MATSNRSSVALPESFSDGDIEFWLRKFELCTAANEWKEDVMLKRLPTLLCGKAFAVFERLEEKDKESFKSAGEALVAPAQQLDLAIQVSLNSTECQINQATVNSYQQPERESMVITQMIANTEVLTEKVNQLSDTVARVNAVPARNLPLPRSRSCFRCGNQGHIAWECRTTFRAAPDNQQRVVENYCFVCGQIGHFTRQLNFRLGNNC